MLVVSLWQKLKKSCQASRNEPLTSSPLPFCFRFVVLYYFMSPTFVCNNFCCGVHESWQGLGGSATPTPLHPVETGVKGQWHDTLATFRSDRFMKIPSRQSGSSRSSVILRLSECWGGGASEWHHHLETKQHLGAGALRRPTHTVLRHL